MAKQGQRYDEQTQTGWKFENGKSYYYLNGKKLSQDQIIARGLEPVTNFVKSVFEPITEGAKNIKKGNVTFLRHPNSPSGESRQQYNTRIAKEQLAIQKKLEVNPEVLKNEAAKKNMSANEYFGVGKYGDRTVADANVRKIDNQAISAQHKLKISKLGPWSVEGLNAQFGTGSRFSMDGGQIQAGQPGFLNKNGDQNVVVEDNTPASSNQSTSNVPETPGAVEIKKQEDLKIKRTMFGMSLRDWQLAPKHVRKRAKRLSNNNVNADLRIEA